MTRSTVGVMILVDYRASAIARGAGRLAFGRWRMGNVEGLRFHKVLGSGRDGGFWMAPSLTHQGLFCVFDGDDAADAFLAKSPLVAAMRADAREFFATKLRAYSSRGRWGGRSPMEVTVAEPQRGPVVSLTRASIRPSKAVAFWRHSPPSERSLRASPGCLLSVGLGEAPVLRQATFTIWENQPAMDAYARSGAHLDAIRAARLHGYFHEDMFARFVPYGAYGTWKGRGIEVLAGLTLTPVGSSGPSRQNCCMTARTFNFGAT